MVEKVALTGFLDQSLSAKVRRIQLKLYFPSLHSSFFYSQLYRQTFSITQKLRKPGLVLILERRLTQLGGRSSLIALQDTHFSALGKT